MTSSAEPTRIEEGRRSLFATGRAAAAAHSTRATVLALSSWSAGSIRLLATVCFLVALAIMPTTLAALVAANILAILFNFVTTGSLVFGARDPRLLPRFFGVYAVTPLSITQSVWRSSKTWGSDLR